MKTIIVSLFGLLYLECTIAQIANNGGNLYVASNGLISVKNVDVTTSNNATTTIKGRLILYGSNAAQTTGVGVINADSVIFQNTTGFNINGRIDVNKYAVINEGVVNTNGKLYLKRASATDYATIKVEGQLYNKVNGLLTIASVNNGTCPFYTSTLTTNISGTPIMYQWQYSNDSIVWNNVSNVNADNYNATVVNNVFYRCVLSSSNSSFIDTTLAVKLSFNDQSTSSTTTQMACGSYVWNGVTYTTSGIKTKTGLTNTLGCDSTAILDLTINTATTSSTTHTACSIYVWNGVTYTTSGVYTQTGLTNALGCDSSATLNLTVNNNTSSTTNLSILNTQLPYNWNGLTFNAAGTQTAHLTNSKGCDSAATLVLSIAPPACEPTSSITNLSICSSALPYNWNGLTFTSAETHTKTGLTNSKGCDSSATLNLSVGNTTNSITTISNCGNYIWNGITYTSSGIYNKLFTGVSGCDSVATLNLTIVNSLPGIIGASAICVGNSTQLSNTMSGGVWFTQATSQATIDASTGFLTGKNAGTITVQYSKTGCVSSTKTITINPIPSVPTITYASGTVNPQAGAPTGSFCVGKTFTVVGTPSSPVGVWSAAGAASVTNGGVVTINSVGAGSIKYTYTSAAGCSNSRTMSGNGYSCAARGANTVDGQQSTIDGFAIYPNPAHSFISLNVETLVGAGSIIVTDLYGKAVKNQPLSMGTNTVDIANLSKGFYLVSIITSEGKNTKKLVVE